jgi:2-octaprenylphenol hydroxylase
VTEHKQYDVVVVGAGLVGASFVALLAQQITDTASASSSSTPIRIAVIDGATAPRVPQPAPHVDQAPAFDPRVVALTHASQQLFKTVGVWQTITEQRACAYTHMHVWDNDGTASIDFSAADIQQEQLGYIVENSILQCAVLDALHDYMDTSHVQIDIMRGVSVKALHTVGQHTSQVTEIECSDARVLSARLVVAADGAQSIIRELSDIPVRAWEYEHKAIVATVKSEKSHQLTAWQNFLSSGPLAFLPLDHVSHQYCSIVWSLDNEKADAMMALDESQFCQQLGRAFEHRLGQVESISPRFCFPLTQRHAVDYSRDNIVLIGDAAHTIHPLAGQGVNLGLLDAQALVIEIMRALERQLAVNEPSILRRYQRKRKAHNVEVMLLMEGFKRLFGSRQLLVRWLRNVGMKKVNEWYLLKNWLAKQAIKNDE